MNETFKRFVDRFNRRTPLSPAVTDDLAYMESALNTVLPLSYRLFITTYGAVYTPSLLNLIVDRQLELPDLQNITSPREAAEATLAYWSGDVPRDLIAFGNDCMGNIYAFKRLVPPADPPADAAVLLFDHDFAEVREVAASFETFFATYLAIPQGSA